MFNSPLDILFILYVALTQSVFMQIFTILLFQVMSWFIKNPRENWYYSNEEEK